MKMHYRWTIAAALLAGICGCGRSVVSDPAPDKDVANAIRNAQSADSEGATEAETVAPTATEWGNLTGRFVFDGQPPTPSPLSITKDVPVCGRHNLVNESLVVGPDGGLANVVVFVNTRSVPVHPDYEATANEKVMFDNEHCRFEPHILALRTSQTLVVHNSDPVSHNSNLAPLGDTSINPLLSEKGAAEHQFKRSQSAPVPVTCSIHPWMKGYVFPRDNPYVAVTDDQGRFTIENLPAAELEFQVWQERPGPLAAKPEWKRGRFKFKIAPGDNDLGEIQVSPDLLN
jgi:hypothetical protein